ncbi:MAG: geranylgeranylglycerol-phosphate geranylgeranyltransferase [Candidatus Freyarchaeota archaeon]
MGRSAAFFRLIRPVNCIMMGFAVIVGAVLARGVGFASEWLSLVLGFVTGFTLTGASMAINDYYDREIDAINEPQRPIPSGAVSPREALVFAFILTAIGFLAALLTNVPCLATAIVAWAIFVVYTTRGKRTGLPGNLLVSACVAIPFVYGNFVVGSVNLAVFLFAAMAFLSNTGREVTKGIVDVEGDRARGVRTVAVSFGAKAAAALAVVFYLSAVALSPLPWLLNLVSFWFVPFVALTDAGLVASSILLLRNYSRENARRVKNMALLWFLLGLLAFLFGAF